ncbi:MAG TPA: hypothetical protein VHS97_21010 [Isosphaeraceae bacterium]|nr:hypothetical protein [Isosphaeraceae bacterium]
MNIQHLYKNEMQVVGGEKSPVSFLSRFRQGRVPADAPRRRRRAVRPGFDPLEGRQLLSLGAGSWQVSVTDGGTKNGSANANAPNGAEAIAWVDNVNGYSEVVVRAFNTAKQAIGGEIRVDYSKAEYSVDDSVGVAIGNNGDFAVVWRNYNFLSHVSSVYVEQFGPSGNPIALNRVGDSAYGFSDFTPDVAIDQSGNVLVSFVESINSRQEVVDVEEINAAGHMGVTLYVNNNPGFTFIDTKLAMSSNGSFAVGYDFTGPGYDGDWDLTLVRYPAGASRPNVAPIIDIQQGSPVDFAISANSGGIFAVAMVDKNSNGTSKLDVTQVDNAGSSTAKTVIDNTGHTLYHPAIALANNGAYVVAYDTTSVLGRPGTLGVDIVEVNSAGSIGLALLDAYGREVIDPALSIDSYGNYIATFTGADGEIRDRGGLLPQIRYIPITPIPIVTLPGGLKI